jgi:hypothetical protein
VKVLRRVGLYVLLAALYLVSTVPVGLFLYSLKTHAGINVFERGGFDTYVQCLRTSFELTDMNYVRSKPQSCGDERQKN